MLETRNLPIKDLSVSGIIIFLVSTLISNIYNPLWGMFYLFGNIGTLIFLSWLYSDSWSVSN